MLGLSTAITKATSLGFQYIKDGLKLYMPYKSHRADEVKFVGTGSTSFDGDDYVDTGATFKTTFDGSFTISAWIKPTDGNPSSDEVVIGTNNADDTDAMWFYVRDGGELGFWYEANNNSDLTLTSSDMFTDGQQDWCYVCAVVDDSLNQVSLYFNGVLQTLSGSYDGDISAITNSDFQSSGTTPNLFIGARSDNGTADSEFTGSIKNVAIWNRVLTATEVQNVMYKQYAEVSGRLASGLVSWWALEETATSTTTADSHGSNTGTLGDGSTSSTYPAFNSDLYGGDTPVKPRAIDNAPTVQADAIGSGSAYFVTGNDDYINCGNSSDFPDDPDGEEFTVTAWFKGDVGADGTIVSKADNSNRAIQLYTDSDDTLIGYIGGTNLDSSTVVADGTWHHVALRSFNDGGTYKGEVYVDGVFKVVGTTGSTTATDRDFLIGARRDADNTDVGYTITGNLCQVGIWSSALTQAQIQSIMEKTYEELTASEKTNLVSYWALDVGENENTTKHYTVADSMSTFGDNLLADGDAGSDNWTNDTGGTNPALVNEKSSEYAKEGTYSRKFVVDGNNDAIHTPTFTTESSGVYQVSFWIRPDSTSVNFYAYQGDGSGTNTTASENGSSTTWFRSFTANEWNKITTYYTESSGGSSAYLEFESPGGSNDQIYYIDEVKVRKVLTGNFGELI